MLAGTNSRIWKKLGHVMEPLLLFLRVGFLTLELSNIISRLSFMNPSDTADSS
jgi:hypothetical protein